MNVCAGVSKKPRLDSELAEEAEQKMAPKLAELHAARDRTEPNSTERHYANSEITRLKQGGPKEYCDSPEAKLQRRSVDSFSRNRTAESYLDLGMDNSGPHISSGFQRSDRKTRLRTGQHFPAATSHRQVIELMVL